MGYAIVRIVFCFGLVVFPAVSVLNRIQKAGIGRGSIFLVTFLLFISVFISSIFPVENKLFTFNSTKAVALYMRGGKPILHVVEGNSSSMIIYAHKPGRMFYKYNHYNMQKDYRQWWLQSIIERTSIGRYKLPEISFVEEIHHDLDIEGDFSVFHAVGTNDYYIFGTSPLREDGFDAIYGYGNSVDEAENNLKRVHITEEGPLVADWD